MILISHSLVRLKDFRLCNYSFLGGLIRLREVAGPSGLGGLDVPSLGVTPLVCSYVLLYTYVDRAYPTFLDCLLHFRISPWRWWPYTDLCLYIDIDPISLSFIP